MKKKLDDVLGQVYKRNLALSILRSSDYKKFQKDTAQCAFCERVVDRDIRYCSFCQEFSEPEKPKPCRRHDACIYAGRGCLKEG
jgi:hypothetical protein